MDKQIDRNIIKYFPKNKLESVDECYKDSDGYWIFLKENWNADRMDYNCHTIHEDTINELRYQIAGIRKVD